MTDRFILFSLPRCGSTTLMNALNCHPGIYCIYEPFNEKKTDIPGFKPVENAEVLDSMLDGLWRRVDGIKHVCVPTGWPFPPKSRLNEHLLLHGERVVFLHRRNLLQQIVSNEMALQSRIFAISGAADRAAIEDFPFQPIEEKKIRWTLAAWRRGTSQFRQKLSQHGVPFMDLTYERLLDPKLVIKQRRKVLNEVYRFLGRDSAADGIDHLRIDELLDPVKTKVNSTDTYRRIPGVEQIERLFGSKENGWLFEPHYRWQKLPLLGRRS